MNETLREFCSRTPGFSPRTSMFWSRTSKFSSRTSWFWTRTPCHNHCFERSLIERSRTEGWRRGHVQTQDTGKQTQKHSDRRRGTYTQRPHPFALDTARLLLSAQHCPRAAMPFFDKWKDEIWHVVEGKFNAPALPPDPKGGKCRRSRKGHKSLQRPILGSFVQRGAAFRPDAWLGGSLGGRARVGWWVD